MIIDEAIPFKLSDKMKDGNKYNTMRHMFFSRNKSNHVAQYSNSHSSIEEKEFSIGSNVSISNTHIPHTYGEHTETNGQYESNKKTN